MDRTATNITRTITALLATLALMAGAVVGEVATGSAPRAEASTVNPNDWRGVVNAYRAMSGLGPVGENGSWSAAGREHSAYMLINGITHVQEAGKPGYTASGHQAGLHGNVAVSSSATWTARQFVELWLTGPFHAIGVLRHNLVTSGYGQHVDANSARWKSGATLDVLRGIDHSRPRPSTPIVFPGRDVTTSLYRFIAEYPNPVTLVGWSGDAGLPLIAMMPNRVTSAQASLTGPNGPVEVRALHEGNTNDDTAKRVMAGDNAVVVVPRNHLANGRYTATVNSNGGNVTWSFTVDRNAPLLATTAPSTGGGTPQAQPTPPPASPPAATTSALGQASGFQPVTPYRFADSREPSRYPGRLVRLNPGQPRTLVVADGAVTAISANFTVTNSNGNGYLSVYNRRSSVPSVSTLNFMRGTSSANQAVVPTSGGAINLVSNVAVDVIVDLNGEFRAGATSRFTPITPTRVLDTRNAGGALAPNQARDVAVVGGGTGVPARATAVAVNLTMVGASSNGYLQAFPAGTPRPAVSNVNVRAGETRPNSAIIPVGRNGRITLNSIVRSHVIVDVTGYFMPNQGMTFTPLEQVRMLDTRVVGALNRFTGGSRLAAGRAITMKVAGVQGVPGDAQAVSINVTAVQPTGQGYVTVYPGSRRPTSSTLNIRPGVPAVANGVMAKLDNGNLTIYVHASTHLVVDINGVWR